jgi:hypothetical protein
MAFEFIEELAAYLSEVGGSLVISVHHPDADHPEMQVSASHEFDNGTVTAATSVEAESVYGAVIDLTRQLGLEPRDEHWVPPVPRRAVPAAPAVDDDRLVMRRIADQLERLANSAETVVDYLDVLDSNGFFNGPTGRLIEDVDLPEGDGDYTSQTLYEKTDEDQPDPNDPDAPEPWNDHKLDFEIEGEPGVADMALPDHGDKR